MLEIPSSPERKRVLTELTAKQDPAERDDFIASYRKVATRQISTIYIELPYIIDVYLGGLLLMIGDNEAAYQSIIDQIPKYNNRILVEHAPYFNGLEITEADLMATLTNPILQEILLVTSPPTNLWKYLRVAHKSILAENRNKDSLGVTVVDKLTYLINTWPLKLDVKQAKELKTKFVLGIGDPDINFGVIAEPGNMMEACHYREFDEWYIYHFHTWSDDPESNGAKALMGLSMEKASIVAPPRVSDPDVVKLLPGFRIADYTELEKRSLIALNGFTTFQYYQPQILLT